MHRLVRTLLSIGNVIHLIQLWILSFIYHKKPPSVPPITDSLFMQSATSLAGKIRRGEIRSYDVTTEYIERIKTVNPFLNAVIENRFGLAVIEAKICDEQLKAGKFDTETLEKEKPLFGVPFTVKECCSLKGLSYTGCTLARKGVKATDDGSVVELLRNAGAIPLCVTNTPEMCANIDSTNLLFGRTCNPYDTRYTAGGSSGGEGALLGAGASLIGIGSDFCGSIRIPAHINGIFGHKPTSGIISNKGHFPTSEDEDFQKYLILGPLTRYAEDLNLIMSVLTSRCDSDLRLNVPVDLRQLKVYYRQSLGKTFGLLPVSPEIEQCVLKVVDHFTQYGVHTEKLPMEWSNTMSEILMSSYMNLKKPPQILIDVNDPKLRKNPTAEMLKALLGQSQHTKATILFSFLIQTHYFFSKAEISYYMQQGETIRQNLLNLLGENGIFIYPTFRIPTTFSSCMLMELSNSLPYIAVANIFGFPATHVPMGLNRDGLPIGIQVIAAPYQDRLCLAVAKELENAFGGWTPPSVSLGD